MRVHPDVCLGRLCHGAAPLRRSRRACRPGGPAPRHRHRPGDGPSTCRSGRRRNPCGEGRLRAPRLGECRWRRRWSTPSARRRRGGTRTPAGCRAAPRCARPPGPGHGEAPPVRRIPRPLRPRSTRDPRRPARPGRRRPWRREDLRWTRPRSLMLPRDIDSCRAGWRIPSTRIRSHRFSGATCLSVGRAMLFSDRNRGPQKKAPPPVDVESASGHKHARPRACTTVGGPRRSRAHDGGDRTACSPDGRSERLT